MIQLVCGGRWLHAVCPQPAQLPSPALLCHRCDAKKLVFWGLQGAKLLGKAVATELSLARPSLPAMRVFLWDREAASLAPSCSWRAGWGEMQ